MTHLDAFLHVRIIIGIVTGLAISRLLTGLARVVRRAEWQGNGTLHVGWALFLLLFIVHFWWFELGLLKVEKWTFELYLFVIFYAILLFVVCTVLFPDDDEYADSEESRRRQQRWFFGLLAAVFLVDLGDAVFKGSAHLAALGSEYLVRTALFCVLSLVAMIVGNRIFQGTFLTLGLIYQIVWIVRQFDVGVMPSG
jgi:hypothetical protein